METEFRKFSVWRLWRHCLESLGLIYLILIKHLCTRTIILNSLNLSTGGAQTKLFKHIDHSKIISLKEDL